MEREIKFRGIRCSLRYEGQNKWVYGNYVESNRSWNGGHPHKSWIMPSPITNGGWFAPAGVIAVKDESVGQFTGYKDNEGKEIFEGDIIRAQYEDCDAYTGWHGLREVTDEVVFEYGSFRLKNTYPFDIGRLWDMNNSKVNVIGNIHEKL